MEHPNENLFHYLRWRGDLTFTSDPLNEADALAFATFSYLDYSAVPDGSDLKHAAPLVKQVMPSPRPSLTGRLDALLEASETARFGPVTVSHYRAIHDEEAGMQFAALCFRLPGGGIVLAYRGTDDTLIGWEEDCRISYAPVIPAQKQAACYAREVCDCYPREPVWITGHSKGGNLAVFAGAYLYARQQKRLAAVFNNDGPGFSPQADGSGLYRPSRLGQPYAGGHQKHPAVGKSVLHGAYLRRARQGAAAVLRRRGQTSARSDQGRGRTRQEEKDRPSETSEKNGKGSLLRRMIRRSDPGGNETRKGTVTVPFRSALRFSARALYSCSVSASSRPGLRRTVKSTAQRLEKTSRRWPR